jgi:hypothetical protein
MDDYKSENNIKDNKWYSRVSWFVSLYYNLTLLKCSAETEHVWVYKEQSENKLTRRPETVHSQHYCITCKSFFCAVPMKIDIYTV